MRNCWCTKRASRAAEALLEVRSNNEARIEFKNKADLSYFWMSRAPKGFKIAHEEAVRKLLPFATTYPCEQGFSTLMNIRKSREIEWTPKTASKLLRHQNVPILMLLYKKWNNIISPKFEMKKFSKKSFCFIMRISFCIYFCFHIYNCIPSMNRFNKTFIFK
jgi:hypothetical protein